MSEDAPPEHSLEWIGDKAFEQYATAIGFLLREWNDLQEKLQDLFVTVVGLQNKGSLMACAFRRLRPVIPAHRDHCDAGA